MAKLKTLVVCPPDHYLLRNFAPIQDQIELHHGATLQEIEPYLADAEILVYSGLTGKTISAAEVWKHAKQVRWVHSLSAGLDKLLFPELVESDVPLTNARGVFKRPLAEFAVLGMLYFYKQLHLMMENQRAHRWQEFSVEWLPGKVMGIVGYGEIGRECALLAKPLGVRIYAMRRNPEKSANDPVLDQAFRPQELNTMLRELDVLVTAAPLTPETRHIIGEPQFDVMKPTSIVINVGRGPLIDEQALTRALQGKKIRGAALDVFEQEPLAADSPLWDMPNVLVSPHCTDRTSNPDWLDLSMQLFLTNFKHYVAGEPLENVVDKKAGY